MAIVLLIVASSLLALQQVSADTCPDNSTQCITESTCCKLISGQFGCCPIPNAVCCSDRQHCCPQGFTCIHDVCTRGSNTLAADVQCPDGEHQCPEEMTCCQTSSSDSTYACCPLPDGVCCSDGQHCCPRGTTCDVAQGGCLPAPLSIMAMTPASERLEDVPCSSTFSCPSGDTCCKVPSGAWGCCPLTGASCCDDHVHCCPHGSRCGPSGCLGMTTDIPIVNLFYLQGSAKVAEPTNVVVCPGGQYECPDKTTCCMLASGAWGCCPAPNAVCCDDHVHCCPHGSRCGPSGCLTTVDIPVVNLFYLQFSAKVADDVVVCPGGQYECPDQTTCCMLASGAWGCCPSPSAVCCDDQIHCCPHGTRCGPTGCLEMTTDTVYPFYLQLSAKIAEPTNVVICPGGQYECPDQTTCCKLPSGAWGCCPLPDAVCCDDHVHCCPNGYTCTSGVCSRANGSSLPWMRKRKANPTGQSFLENL